MGRVLSVVVDCLMSDNSLGIFTDGVPGVHIAVMLGEIAAGNLHTNLMPRLKDHSCAAHIDSIAIYGSRNQQLGPVQSLTETAADDAFGNIVGGAVLSDVHKLGGKIGVYRTGGCPEIDFDWADDGNVFLQYVCAVY